jgi:hypothetical protein
LEDIMEENTITFDSTQAKVYTPIMVPKYARIVEKKHGEVSEIMAEWGSPQSFIGTYVEIIDPETGDVKYGSGYDEWVNTNTRWPGIDDCWYKSSPVSAHVSKNAGVLVTVLANGHEETRKAVQPGDWLVRQQDGEIMCIGAAKFPTLYSVGG